MKGTLVSGFPEGSLREVPSIVAMTALVTTSAVIHWPLLSVGLQEWCGDAFTLWRKMHSLWAKRVWEDCQCWHVVRHHPNIGFALLVLDTGLGFAFVCFIQVF